MIKIKESYFKVPLTRLAHKEAQKFYRYHADSQKAKQVYLNTLAVYAVNYYLICLGVETDLLASDSYDLVMQSLADVADLVIKGRGQLECRPVLHNSEICQIPPEVWWDRLSYVVVQFNRELTEATLLGFVKTVTTEKISLHQLEPLEKLLDNLVPMASPVHHLRQWFEEIFSGGWQSLEEFVNHSSQELIFSLRSPLSVNTKATATSAKLINLGVDLGNQSVVLLITIVQEENGEIGVQVQLHPDMNQSYLPPFIKLALISETEEILQEVTARHSDNFVQLPYFQGTIEEGFSLGISLNNITLIEKFTF